MSRIKLNTFNQVEEPTIILAKRSGDKIGSLPAYDIVFKENMLSGGELSFSVSKYNNGVKCGIWRDIKDFRLVYCKEWDLWFEIAVTVDENNAAIKNITAQTLCEAELSQVKLFNIEINTEADIERDDYIPTILLNEDNKSASLLHRITEKVPHYTIVSVDSTIASIQKTFSFNNKSIYDAFQEIAEEIGCLFVLSSASDDSGKPTRTICVYDLQNNCENCGHRGEFTDICPKCGKTSIKEGFGTDTTVYISADCLAEDVRLETDTGAVKNCFKLKSGDALMDATIRSCNPNGTDYIWYFSDDVKADMSSGLVSKIGSYDDLYKNYQSSEEFKLSVGSYNSLVEKYHKSDSEYKINSPITGYGNLMTAYYNAIDFEIYLQSGMLPSADNSGTTANGECGNLNDNFNTAYYSGREWKTMSKAIANQIVIATAKTLININYDIKIYGEPTYDNSTWTGVLEITAKNITEKEKDNPTANPDKIYHTDTLEVVLIDAYTEGENLKSFIEQEVRKSLVENTKDEFSIEGLFKKEGTEFETALKKYSLDALTSIYYCAQAALDIMIEYGANNSSSQSINTEIDEMYKDYYKKFNTIQAEIKTREEDIEIVTNLQDEINDKRISVQNALNFEHYIKKDEGESLWIEFCSFRREDEYNNSNYISDGLTNAELIKRAEEFIKVASDEIYKSAELQHSISSTLKNLLAMPEFTPLTEHFAIGNWLRVRVDDDVYKLRLIEYEIDFSDLENINVDFSDVTKVPSGVTDLKSIFEKANSMATSYDTVKRQATQGAESKTQLDSWVDDGLELTTTRIVNNADSQAVTFDERGILLRKHFPISDTYSDEQVKIINNGLYVTTDSWQTSKAAIGSFIYKDPKNNMKETEGYGVIADTIVGNLILGTEVGIYNESNSFEVTENGMIISNKDKEGITNPVTIKMNPNDGNIFDISKKTEKGADKIFTVDKNGNASINNIIMGGNITWDTSSNPVKVLYAQNSITKPVDYNPKNTDNGYKQYEEYGESSDSTWHRKLGENDKFVSYSYDDGKTWSEKILIRGKDGVDGNDFDRPGYIESTYIDFTKVLSPEVRGNFILGGSIIGGEYYDATQTGKLTLATHISQNTSFADLIFKNKDNKELFKIYDGIDATSMYLKGQKLGDVGVDDKTFTVYAPVAFKKDIEVNFSGAKVSGLTITFG